MLPSLSILLAWLPAWVAAQTVPIVPDAATVRAGQRLFQSATAADGSELQAALFGGESRLSGQPAACAGCHGEEGRGRFDAGLVVPDIRWETLTRERKAQPGGPARPAYDELSLLRALRSGVDAAGRRLAAAMPRFELTPRQAAEVVAYLQRVGTPSDLLPGVDAATVQVAIVVRHERDEAPHVAAAAACLREANERGGVYDRRLNWTVHRAGDLPDETAWRHLADRAALVLAPAWRSQEELDRFSRWAARDRLLVLGPVGVPSDSPASTATTFRVVADPAVGWRAVIDHLAARHGAAEGPLVVRGAQPVQGEGAPEWPALRHHVQGQPKLRWQEARSDGAPAGDAAGAAAGPPHVVLVPGNAAQVAQVAQTLAARGVPAAVPIVAASGRIGPAAMRLPASIQARLQLMHAHPLDDELRPQALRRALESQGARLTQPALQSTAFAAGCLAVQGLQRAGRQVTHAGLRDALNSVRDLATGVTMPLTYGARQREGVWGARLVRLEGERLVPVTPWLTPAAPPP